MEGIVIGDYWPDGTERGDNKFFEWDDEKIRRECLNGTNRELAAYLRAGYTLKPDMFPYDASEALSSGMTAAVTMREVAVLIAEKHRFTLAQLLGGAKRKELIEARREAIWIMYSKLGKSLPQIGKFFGRDHSTIHHHLMKIQNLKQWKKKNAVKLERYHTVYGPIRAMARGDDGENVSP